MHIVTVCKMTGFKTLNRVVKNVTIWIARLDKISEAIRVTGEGKEYILRIDQLVVRKGKKHMSDEQRAAMSERMRKLRSVQGTT